MINFKSESANKAQQNNAKILFGSKGVSILSKLEEYSKEKSLDTSGIDALLEVLKTKDTALLEKFASSKTGKTLVTNCKQLASAKTFSAIIKNIKAIKPLKSFDKFITLNMKPGVPTSSTRGRKAKARWVDLSPKGKKPTHYIERDIVAELDSKNRFNLNDDATSDMVDLLKMSKVSGVEVIKRVGPGGGNPFVRILGNEHTLGELINHFESEGDIDARSTMPIKPLESSRGIRGGASITKGGRKSKQLDLNSQDPSTFADALDLAGDSNSPAYKKVVKHITTQARKLGNIPRNWNVSLEPYSVDTEGYFLEIYPKSALARGEGIADLLVICLGGLSAQNPNSRNWSPTKNSVAVIEQIDFDDYGDVDRMGFAKALNYVIKENAKL